MARFNDKELASDFLKSLVGLPDDVRKDAVLSLINMVVNGKDIPDDELNGWIDLYPEENREGLKGHFIYGNISSDDDKKNQPPADIAEDKEVKDQLDANQKMLDSMTGEGMSDEDIDAEIDRILADIDANPAEGSEEATSESGAEEPESTGDEEQDETTRNIIAGLSDK